MGILDGGELAGRKDVLARSITAKAKSRQSLGEDLNIGLGDAKTKNSKGLGLSYGYMYNISVT